MLRDWLEKLVNETLGEPETYPVTVTLWTEPRLWVFWPKYRINPEICKVLLVGPFSIRIWQGEFAKRPKKLFRIF